MVEGKGQCSTQVEPSPHQDPISNQEQDEGPLATEQDQGQDQTNEGGGAPSDYQDLVLDQEPPQVIE